jgi:glycosyltransferase involved in cell wall biosynthesis/SAM-dependent methyltransferase
MNADESVLEPATVAPAALPFAATKKEVDPGLVEVEKNWNEFGKRDPLWAILTDESKRDNKWDLADFFATGEREINGVMQSAEKLGHTFARRTALDFGCGVGRLTQALCGHFKECHGIDIAESMVEQARQHNRYGVRCHYHVNRQPDLSLFANDTFDFVYTNIVLQHNPPAMSRRFIQEFLRILTPNGLLVFQMPSEPIQLSRGEGKPLRDGAFKAQIRLAENDAEFVAGTAKKLSVTVKNLSAETWPAPSQAGRFPVRLGNHWRDANNRMLINDDARAELPHAVKPGEEVTLSLSVTVPGIAGAYRLELDLVQEMVAWFGGKGSATLTLDLAVKAKSNAAGAEASAPRKDDMAGVVQEMVSWFDAKKSASAPASPAAAKPGSDAGTLIPRMEMNGIRKEEMLAFLISNDAKILKVADDSSASGWTSYRYYVTKENSGGQKLAPIPVAPAPHLNQPLPAPKSGTAKSFLGEISVETRAACEQFLASYAEASHPRFLVAAYNFIFQRGIDEAGYNNCLIKLYAGFDRAELLRDFANSEEFKKLQAQENFRLPAIELLPQDAPLPPRSTLEQYQDIWVKGKLHKKGVRECEDRFALIRDFCAQFKRPFTILDIGSNLSYFSLRLTETFDCTSVAVEGIYGDWIQEVLELNETKRVVLLKKIIKLADLRAMAEVEHFDVVLGLSVIHHLDGSFAESLEVLRSLGDHVILELPFEANACGQQLVKEAVEAKLPDDSIFMGFGKSHLAEGQRQIVRLSRPKTRITKSYLGTPRTDLALTIQSDFAQKRVEFHNKPETRPWLRGINLQTYLWFNGAYPAKTQIADALQKSIPAKQHRDIQSWNVVLQGTTVELIDNDDPNHAFAYEDQKYLDRLLLLLRAESMGEAAIKALHAQPIAVQSKLTLPVRWRGPIFNPSGYASEAINYLLPLSEEVELGIFHLNNNYSEKFVAGLSAPDRDRLFALRDKYEQIKGGIVIDHNPANGFAYVSDAAYRIGRTMFETDRISPAWVNACNQMDEVWVPSRFNAETFAASGVERDKLVVMPESVDENEFNPDQHEPLPLPNRAKFNFLAIFEWSRRKGWDVLLSAYLREFSAEDDVCLYLRTYLFSKPDGDPREAIQRLIDEHAATLNLGEKVLPRIHIIAEQVAQADLPRLYKAADCLVAPSRGEGWGRPHHEAMMMGLPVIATNWSGNTEFMNAANSYPVDYDLGETVALDPELRHYHGHRWANPSEKSLRDQMRRVQQHPILARAKGLHARRDMLKNYSRESVTKLVVTRLLEIERKLSTPVCPPAKASVVNKSSEVISPKTKHLQVAWEGSFLDFGSLSHVNRELTSALYKGNKTHLTRVGNNALPAQLAGIPELKNLSRRIESEAPRQVDVTVRHAWPPNWQRPANGAWVLIQPWEFGVLPADWVQKLTAVDEVWAPTEHVRKVYVESGIHPSKVKVVPNGIDPQKFNPDAKPLKLATQKKFKFLFVGGTIQRKGPDVLLKAYLQTFTAADDVCLVIKDFGGQSVYRGQTFEKQIAAARQNPNAPEILYLTEEMTPEQMPGLYTACDGLLHPYRGEGFGLPVLEAMACGLSVVVTGGGATDDFATDEYAYRLPALKKLIGENVGGMKLQRNGWWLEPQIEALNERIKWIFENREAAQAKGKAASEYARREWTWERAAEIAGRRLQEVAAKKQAQVAAVAERRARRARGIALPEVAKLGNLIQANELLGKKNFLEAWSSTLAALAIRPFHCEAYLLLAEIAKAAGDTKQAKLCAGYANQIAPNWKPIKQFLKNNFTAGRGLEWGSFPEPRKTPRLSVCLIVRNEEKFLVKCLESIREIAQQIVVVDTGSTDATVEIARKFSAEVHRFKWDDDFSAARNEALKHANGDWVLFLDADEELLPEHRETLLKEIQSAEVMAYRLPIIDIGREREGNSFVPRLFRNAPGLFFIGRVHEQIFSSIEVRCREWSLTNCHGKSALLHHGYVKEVVVSRDKIARNLRLLELAIEELPNEPNLLMNYGLELVRSGQLEAGLEQTLEAFHLLSMLPADQVVPELRETLFTQLGTHLFAGKCYDEVIKIWQTPFGKATNATASQHFILGLSHMELKQPKEAAEHMRQCLKKRGQKTLSPINPEILQAGPNHCLALSLVALKDMNGAVEAFQAALKDDSTARVVRFDLARFHAQQGQFVEALKLLHALVAENADDLPGWEFGGQIALGQPEFLDFAQNWTAEAVKHFPACAAILLQRAEALLLSHQIPAALSAWMKTGPAKSAKQLAALTLCEVVSGASQRQFTAADEKVVSQEFLNWYRKLIKFNAYALVKQVNERLEDLRVVLPSAAGALEKVLKRAPEPVTA